MKMSSLRRMISVPSLPFLTLTAIMFLLFLYVFPRQRTESRPWNPQTLLDKNDRIDNKSEVVPNLEFDHLLAGPVFLQHDDVQLVNHIKNQMVFSPNTEGKPILSKEIHKGQVGQVDVVVDYFKKKKGGFFMEAGAWDGEYLSNTLFLEVELGWTGILVEPNKGAFDLMKTRKRNAVLLNSCLSVHRYPEEIDFDAADVFGGIVGEEDSPESMKKMRDGLPAGFRDKYKMQCYPVYSILLALGNPEVDFLSIDIEGAELKVLETIPWDKVKINAVLIEVEHSDSSVITKFMDEAGYKVHHKFGAQDILYVKK